MKITLLVSTYHYDGLDADTEGLELLKAANINCNVIDDIVLCTYQDHYELAHTKFRTSHHSLQVSPISIATYWEMTLPNIIKHNQSQSPTY